MVPTTVLCTLGVRRCTKRESSTYGAFLSKKRFAPVRNRITGIWVNSFHPAQHRCRACPCPCPWFFNGWINRGTSKPNVAKMKLHKLLVIHRRVTLFSSPTTTNTWDWLSVIAWQTTRYTEACIVGKQPSTLRAKRILCVGKILLLWWYQTIREVRQAQQSRISRTSKYDICPSRPTADGV